MEVREPKEAPAARDRKGWAGWRRLASHRWALLEGHAGCSWDMSGPAPGSVSWCSPEKMRAIPLPISPSEGIVECLSSREEVTFHFKPEP